MCVLSRLLVSNERKHTRALTFWRKHEDIRAKDDTKNGRAELNETIANTFGMADEEA